MEPSTPTPSASPPPYHDAICMPTINQQQQQQRYSFQQQQQRRRQQQRRQRRQRETEAAVSIIYPPTLFTFSTQNDEFDDENDDVESASFVSTSDNEENCSISIPPRTSATTTTTTLTVMYPERVVLNGLQAISFQSPLPPSFSQREIFSSHDAADAERRQQTAAAPFYEEHFSCSPPPILILAVSLVQCIIFGALSLLDSVPTTTTNSSSSSSGGSEDVPCLYESLALSWHNWLHQPWRLITYAFLHNDVWHLLYTVGSQAVLGVCLELVHTWRVLVIYLCGLLGGAVGYLIFSYAKYYYLLYYADVYGKDPLAKEYLALLPETIIIGSSSGCYALLACQFVNFALNYRSMVMASLQLMALVAYALIEVLAQVLYYQPSTNAAAAALQQASSAIDDDHFSERELQFRPSYTAVVVRPGVMSRDSLWRLDEYDDDSTYYDMIVRALRESRTPANTIWNESTACHVFGALAGLAASLLLLKRVGGENKRKIESKVVASPSTHAGASSLLLLPWRRTKRGAL